MKSQSGIAMRVGGLWTTDHPRLSRFLNMGLFTKPYWMKITIVSEDVVYTPYGKDPQVVIERNFEIRPECGRFELDAADGASFDYEFMEDA